jgi:hypothetical protein
MLREELNFNISAIHLIKVSCTLLACSMLASASTFSSTEKSNYTYDSEYSEIKTITSVTKRTGDYSTNNPQASAPQKVIWIDTVNVTVTNKSLITKSSFNSARSSQVISSSSNGYVQCEWSILARAHERGWKFGFISADDKATVGTIKMTVNFLANTNTDVYEGITYVKTLSGGTFIQKNDIQHRWRVDRLTQKIYYETSNNGKSWTLRATYSKKVTGDLRAGFYGNESGKEVLNAMIQADKGIEF